MSSLKVAPIQSFVDSSFFTTLSELKLDLLKLDLRAVPLVASSSFRSLGPGQLPAVDASSSSFGAVGEYLGALPPVSSVVMEGEIHNVNTIEEFKLVDKQGFLAQAGEHIATAVADGSAWEEPSVMLRFAVLSYADLKKYRFYYWFAFPSVASEWSIQALDAGVLENETLLVADYLRLEEERVGQVPGFFLLDGKPQPLSAYSPLLAPCFGFVDTSTVANTPAWPLKNYLYLLHLRGLFSATVLVYRANGGSFKLTLSATSTTSAAPKFVGWERNLQGKLGPKVADLGLLIDPIQLANQAVDLNLKLMKWRIAPKLDLDTLRATKCLLLGAGTLGLYVARALMGWGFRDITLVDSGKVLFSNPVRQPLFEFSDCLSGGRPKAEAAAAALKRVFPGVDAKGVQLEIPMVGHPVAHEERQLEEFHRLEALIKESDAVFLLVDLREARWLPTVIGKAHGKAVINAALGFDSYLVMRHGAGAEGLGCYFCNDVVAPSDSLSDRTLDQMCTVTRPGVALVASALAVELLATVLQHPEQAQAPASDDSLDTVLGAVPHQIRGFLHSWDSVKLRAPSFPQCSACSQPITEGYLDGGWEFVKRCLNSSTYVADVSGLTAVHEAAEAAAAAAEREMERELEAGDEDDEWTM